MAAGVLLRESDANSFPTASRTNPETQEIAGESNILSGAVV